MIELLNLDKLGAREVRPGTLDFGLLLPGITSDDGYKLSVKIIHHHDQFLQDIQPSVFEMSHGKDPVYGDYWSAEIPVDTCDKPLKNSAWGTSGRYVYRYFLSNPEKKIELDWIIDPFAREFGIGKLSAITAGYKPYVWSRAEADWKTPALEDLVIYELMISEFGGSIDEATHRLDYLADLGINCIEVMPVSNVDSVIDWGYLPIGYFGVDERFGKRKDFQHFVDEAHKRGIAVILDSVYGHTSSHFLYAYVYANLPGVPNPFCGVFVDKRYGESTNFGSKLTRAFFFTANMFWLDRFHVDGFRFDCVPEYYDGADGKGYAKLVRSTYEAVKTHRNSSSHWNRFFDGKKFNLILCAEHLDNPVDVLSRTCTNCVWQDTTITAAEGAAQGNRDQLTRFALSLGLLGYPGDAKCNGDPIRKSSFQYIENHDHSRFIGNFGTTTVENNDLLKEGRRELWYKVQPYLIALFTAKGIPFLWQGEEFCENYCMPRDGRGRVLLFRPMRWDYFYDPYGKSIADLVRKLIRLRRSERRFRHGGHYFFNHWDNYQSRNVMLFSRSDQKSFSLVALNFGDGEKTVPFTFPHGGNYREELHGEESLSGIIARKSHDITIPGNYGRIWTTDLR